MAAKPKSPKTPPRNKASDTRNENIEKYTALLASDASARGSAAAQKYAQAMFGDEVTFDAYFRALRIQTDDVVKAGNMTGIETMLVTQANTLDLLFNQLARNAASSDHLTQFQVHLSLALKAQAQSRATLEALAEIKNPRPVAFVKHANIAHGPQQVNNGTDSNAPSAPHARGKNGETTNELLTDERNGQTMDGGTASEASRSDPALATVGKREGAA